MRISFGTVIECQHRAMIHIDAVIRLDDRRGQPMTRRPWLRTLCAQAISTAAASAAVTLPHRPGTHPAMGAEADVRIVCRDTAGEAQRPQGRRLRGENSSKGTEDCGGIPRRIRLAAYLDDYYVARTPGG